MISDQGKNLVGNLAKTVYRVLGIDHLATSPNHPQSNGLCERTNRTIVEVLRKLCHNHAADWDELIDFALAQMRFCVQKSIGDSPYFVMTGQDPTLPMDFLTQPDIQLERKDAYWKSEFFKRMQAITDDARAEMTKTQERMREMGDDKNIRPREFAEGDFVRKFTRKRKELGKLDYPMSGSYRIIKKADNTDNAYVVMTGDGPRTYNVTDLLPYVFRLAEPVIC